MGVKSGGMCIKWTERVNDRQRRVKARMTMTRKDADIREAFECRSVFSSTLSSPVISRLATLCSGHELLSSGEVPLLVGGRRPEKGAKTDIPS